MRIIKKYSNRRLYDTEESRYITLSEIKEYVISHVDFEIRDAKTNQILTNTVLLQIILEEENFNKPIFTTEILKNLIRFYGNPAQQKISDFLEKFTRTFTENIPPESINNFTNLAKQNIELWNQSVEKFMTEFVKKQENDK